MIEASSMKRERINKNKLPDSLIVSSPLSDNLDLNKKVKYFTDQDNGN